MKRMRHGMSIMLRERPLGQESELKTQRQRSGRSSEIQRQLEMWDWQSENPKCHFTRWWLLSETSERYRKFRQWRWCGRWRWWRDTAGPAQRRWRTWLGDGQNHQNGEAAHGQDSAEAGEAWRTDPTGMSRCSGLLPGTRQDVRNIWIKGSGSRSTTNRWWCSGTCTEHIWRATGVSWHCLWNIANAARDFSTRQYSYEDRFGRAAAKHEYTLSCDGYGAGFITYLECEPCWTRQLWPLHSWSPANHHMDIGFGPRNCNGSCVPGGLNREICIFDVISWWNAICIPILLCVSIFLISGTKLWDMIICLCMCKGRTHHTKGLESISHCKTANTCDYCLPITLKWESKCYISD